MSSDIYQMKSIFVSLNTIEVFNLFISSNQNGPQTLINYDFKLMWLTKSEIGVIINLLY